MAEGRARRTAQHNPRRATTVPRSGVQHVVQKGHADAAAANDEFVPATESEAGCAALVEGKSIVRAVKHCAKSPITIAQVAAQNGALSDCCAESSTVCMSKLR